jgi:hypothetical protein
LAMVSRWCTGFRSLGWFGGCEPVMGWYGGEVMDAVVMGWTTVVVSVLGLLRAAMVWWWIGNGDEEWWWRAPDWWLWFVFGADALVIGAMRLENEVEMVSVRLRPWIGFVCRWGWSGFELRNWIWMQRSDGHGLMIVWGQAFY